VPRKWSKLLRKSPTATGPNRIFQGAPTLLARIPTIAQSLRAFPTRSRFDSLSACSSLQPQTLLRLNHFRRRTTRPEKYVGRPQPNLNTRNPTHRHSGRPGSRRSTRSPETVLEVGGSSPGVTTGSKRRRRADHAAATRGCGHRIPSSGNECWHEQGISQGLLGGDERTRTADPLLANHGAGRLSDQRLCLFRRS
jgi:hypothetical protein